MPELRIPAVGARIMDLQEPDAQDVDDRRHRAGHGATCSTSRRRSRRSSRAPSPTPAARCAAAPEKAGIGNLIEILAAVRGVAPDAVEARVRRRPLRRLQGRRRRRRSIEYLRAGARALRRAARATRPSSSAILAAGADRAREIAAPRRSRTCARGMGVGAAPAVRRIRADDRAPAPVSLASLELDLDVFSGPFDLLLTLVLREEVDLLELALADVVLAYLDHLEAARRARPRGGDRVHRADRRAAGAEVAADAQRRRRGAARHRARAGRRGAARADARRRAATARPPGTCASCSRPRTACASARRRCRRRCGARIVPPADGSETRRSVLGEAIGRLLAMPPRSASATSARRA